MPAHNAKPPVELWCLECGAIYTVQPYRAEKSKFCSWICGQRSKSKLSAQINGPKQRGGGLGKTYIKLNGRHMHRVIAEQKLGRALKPGEIVHHKDGNKRNNAPDNLDVMYQPDHVRHHHNQMLYARLIAAGY